MTKHFYFSKRGFTLTEVILCSVILIIVLIGPLDFFVRNARNVSFARHTVQAIYLAKLKMEEVRRYPFANIANRPDTPIPIDATDNYWGTYKIVVTPIDAYRKYVRVQINWNEPSLGQGLVGEQYLETDIANEPQLN